MLRALLADLAGPMCPPIVTTIDDRLDLDPAQALEVVPITPGSHRTVFRELAAAAHNVWIVAPETGGCLATLTEIAEAVGARPVGATSTAIRIASDKLRLSRRLAEAGIPVPRTWPAADAGIAVREVGFPLVAKPVLGAGCEGIGLANDSTELAHVTQQATRPGGTALVQEYIDGTAASASIICSNGRARALSLNGQDIHPGRSFSYTGGCVPLGHPLADEALAVACRACELVPGLAGYVGVDLVLSDHGPFVIEINPRLTTSYVGLRTVTDLNLAEVILEIVERGELPDGPKIDRKVQFTASGSTEKFQG